MAGRSNSSKPFVPYASSSNCQPETAPRIVTPCGEVSSGGVGPAALIASSEAAAAERPEPLTATTLPPPGGAKHIDGCERGDRHGGRRHPVHGIDGAAPALMEVSQLRVLSVCREIEPTVFRVEVKPARASFCNPFRRGAICMDLASAVEIN